MSLSASVSTSLSLGSVVPKVVPAAAPSASPGNPSERPVLSCARPAAVGGTSVSALLARRGLDHQGSLGVDTEGATLTLGGHTSHLGPWPASCWLLGMPLPPGSSRPRAIVTCPWPTPLSWRLPAASSQASSRWPRPQGRRAPPSCRSACLGLTWPCLVQVLYRPPATRWPASSPPSPGNPGPPWPQGPRSPASLTAARPTTYGPFPASRP